MTSETSKRQIVANLRGTFGAKLGHLGDADLLEEYANFSLSDMTGSNDARFLEWLEIE